MRSCGVMGEHLKAYTNGVALGVCVCCYLDWLSGCRKLCVMNMLGQGVVGNLNFINLRSGDKSMLIRTWGSR